MNPQVTIKDIARLCNTSVSTVSRVLNGHPDVSEPLRARVLEAAEKAGYVANGSLRNKSKSNTIAVIQRGEGNLFFPQLLQSLLPSIYKRQYSCLLYQIATDGDEIRAATALARKERLPGHPVSGRTVQLYERRAGAPVRALCMLHLYQCLWVSGGR